jgi:hypothetical protein
MGKAGSGMTVYIFKAAGESSESDCLELARSAPQADYNSPAF